jgi:hypothetical protein
MMGFAVYTARRQLAPGHIVGVSYELPLRLTAANRSSEIKRQVAESLSGATEYLYFGEVYFWDITFASERGHAQAILREFLASTASGESFQFDPYGTPDAISVNFATVRRADSGISPQRVLSSTRDGANDWFQYTMRVREV